jgi:hypothetical protein
MGISLCISKPNAFGRKLSREDRRCIRHHVKHYLIIGDTLYCRGIDSILRRFLTHDEAEMFSMTVTPEHVAVIFLGWLQPKNLACRIFLAFNIQRLYNCR